MQPTRREMLGSLGALATAGGWIAMNGGEALADTGGGALPPAKEYVLPPLPYAYDALEPYIDKETMMLHHDKHAAAYVKGVNAAIAGLTAVRQAGKPEDLAQVRALTDALAFNGSGAILHDVFWPNMKKNGGGEPKGELSRYVARDFGSFSGFQAQFNEAGLKVQGSGWSILAWEPLAARLVVLSAEKHQNVTMWGCVPLLVMDVWEHAYYLKYQNKRADYIQAFGKVVNWDNVAERLNLAQKLTA